MDNRKESRKRLRPWLERMIENSRCPGLVWENRDERTFRIPWRHFNNKDWDAVDSQVFMEWARYTGRYHDGEREEYPVWKTRLRCALKKIPEIRELPDQHHLEDTDPYRVYQFVDIPLMRRVNDFDSDYSASPGSNNSFFTNSPKVRDFLEESESSPPPKYSGDSFLGPKPASNVPTVVYEEDTFNYNNLTVKREQYSGNAAGVARETMNHQPAINDQHYDTDSTNYHAFNISSEDESNFFNPMHSASHNFSNFTQINQSEFHLMGQEVSEGPAGMQQDSIKERFPSDLMSIDSSDLLRAETGVPSFELQVAEGTKTTDKVMHLTIKYGFPHIAVGKEMVAANGCRLYFGQQQFANTIMYEEMFGPKTVTQIEMPDVRKSSEMCDTQKRFICELLDSMERGLVLTYKDGDIYAQRLCRTRVFVSDGKAESVLLNRKEKSPTKVFDFAAFKTSFQRCETTQNSVLPRHYFYLTFGQEIKRNRSEPMGRVLIHVEVIHTEAAEYATKFSLPEGSHSMLPLLSSFDTNDHLLQEFKKMSVN